MRHITYFSLVALSSAVVGCTQSPTPTNATDKTVATSATSAQHFESKLPANAPIYKMGVEPTYPPLSFKDGEGEIIGFDKDIIQAVGENQGFKVQVVSMPNFDTIFNSLDTGENDIIGGGIGITEERKNAMNLSDSILTNYNTVAYRADKRKIESLDDVRNGTLGIDGNSVYRNEINSLYGDKKEHIKPYKTTFLAFKDMVNGQVDMVFEDNIVLSYHINNLKKSSSNIGEIKLYSIPSTESQSVGFAVKKGRDDLTQKINLGIANIKADGTYNKIYKKWFGDIALPSNNVNANSNIATVNALSAGSKTSTN